MVFPFLVVLTIIFLALVKNVNSKLNNPDDTSFGSETSGSQSEENKDDDFPPVDEVFQNNKEPERDSEPVFTARMSFCYGPLGEEIEFFQE